MKTLLLISSLYAFIALTIHYGKYKTLDISINYPKLWTILTYEIALIATSCP